MSKIQMPWEDRPSGCTDVMWRYSQNPVIGRYHIPSSNSISTVRSYLLRRGLQGYSVVIIKLCR